MSWTPTHVSVAVNRARNLLPKAKDGRNDAFVTISLGKEKFQTSTKIKTDLPEWREECELRIPDMKSSVILNVYNRSLLGLDDFLGQVALPLSDFQLYDRPRSKWYSLKGKAKHAGKKSEDKYRGELEVKVKYIVKSKPQSNSSLDSSLKRTSSIKALASSVGEKLKHSPLSSSKDEVPQGKKDSPREKRDHSPQFGRKNTGVEQVRDACPKEPLIPLDATGLAIIANRWSDFNDHLFKDEEVLLDGTSEQYPSEICSDELSNDNSVDSGDNESPLPSPSFTRKGSGYWKKRNIPQPVESAVPPKLLGNDVSGGSLTNVTEGQESVFSPGSPKEPTILIPPANRGEGETDQTSKVILRKNKERLRRFKEGRPRRHTLTDGVMSKSAEIIIPRDYEAFQTKQADSDLPDEYMDQYKDMTHEELVGVIFTQKLQLDKRDTTIKDLEGYIDKLLVRVMETDPLLLQSHTQSHNSNIPQKSTTGDHYTSNGHPTLAKTKSEPVTMISDPVVPTNNPIPDFIDRIRSIEKPNFELLKNHFDPPKINFDSISKIQNPFKRGK
ncbi:unnamed protein product [Owenia fusiformis]|uniref:Uncharacterized protein n=1 Tax=Owenia fusiformis TaxID=6347 RepID=A0A8J1U4U1_OWEFU|nr:unnamed protein product [Owenia fusiformis]